jgi:hypothetical protein
MSGTLKLGLILIFGVVVVGWALQIIAGLWGLIKAAAIIAGIGLIAYGLVNRRALTGGKRYLP